MKDTNNYELLKETYSIVGRVEGKLDKMEARVSAIELWRAQIMGQIIVILAVVNFTIAISFDWIKKQIFHDKI